MNVTIRFSNPFCLVTFSAAMFLIGWAIGARWGHSATAGYALFWAIVALLVHDAAMVILTGIGGYKFALHLRNKDWR
jgi:TRAP-type mannitol/chloroaromatic compound transport system permease small subunit